MDERRGEPGHRESGSVERRFLNPEFIAAQGVLVLRENIVQTPTTLSSDIRRIIAEGKPIQGERAGFASFYERDLFWNQGINNPYKDLTYSQKMETWAEQTRRFLNQFIGKPEERFLGRLGIDLSKGAESLYRNYFADGKSNIDKFVANVTLHNTGEEIEENRHLIQKLSKVFGVNTSQVVELMIDGVKNAQTDLAGFLQEITYQTQATGTAQPKGWDILDRFSHDSGKGYDLYATKASITYTTLPWDVPEPRPRVILPAAPTYPSAHVAESPTTTTTLASSAPDLFAPPLADESTGDAPLSESRTASSVEGDLSRSAFLGGGLGDTSPEPSVPPPANRPTVIELTSPKNLIGELNTRLQSAPTGNVDFELSPSILPQFLETIPKIKGKIKKLDVSLAPGSNDHDKVVLLNGNVGKLVGGVKFAGLQIANDGRGGIVVLNPDVLDYYGAGHLIRRDIEDSFTNLNELLNKQIQDRITVRHCAVTGLTIRGDKLVLKVRKN